MKLHFPEILLPEARQEFEASMPIYASTYLRGLGKNEFFEGVLQTYIDNEPQP